MLKCRCSLAGLFNYLIIYMEFVQSGKLKIMEIINGGKRTKHNNNRFCVTFDQFPIIYEAIQTIVNALFNSTKKIFLV